ncbi:MAG: hypothetical protein JXQ73_32915 [Phycisphaerae bacterium]|nr:hypothetical protein [Phycisphaerae bacterium]
MNAIDPTAAEIMTALRSSGYLMEQEVASLLESLGYHVRTNSPYRDPDEGKSRELDVVALRRIARNDDAKVDAFAHVICECKNNSYPLLFIGRPKAPIDARHNPSEHLFPYPVYEERVDDKTWREVPAFRHLGLDEYHYYFTQDTKAVQFCKLLHDKKQLKAEHAGLYESIFLPLIKGVNWEQEQVSGRRIADWKSIDLFFPTVVVRGPLYYVDAGAEVPEPVRVTHVSCFREVASRSVSGQYLIEVVEQCELARFVDGPLSHLFKEVARLVEEAPDRIRTQRE